MELRRALLLFAIVLAIAAVVTALTGGSGHRDPDPAPNDVEAAGPSTPTLQAGDRSGDGGGPTVRFDAAGPPSRRSVTASSAATVLVSADESGDVQIGGLGLFSSVEPADPARFDVLTDRASRYAVTFTPAGESTPRRIGTLIARAPAP